MGIVDDRTIWPGCAGLQIEVARGEACDAGPADRAGPFGAQPVEGTFFGRDRDLQSCNSRSRRCTWSFRRYRPHAASSAIARLDQARPRRHARRSGSASRSAARRRADRARGLTASSVRPGPHRVPVERSKAPADGVTGSSGRWREGRGPAPLRAARNCLTMRSSSEWKATTTRRPPGTSSCFSGGEGALELAELVVQVDAQRLKGASRGIDPAAGAAADHAGDQFRELVGRRDGARGDGARRSRGRCGAPPAPRRSDAGSSPASASSA